MAGYQSARPRPSDPLELAFWLFMRLSGLLLVFLALGHLAIMHLINNVDVINYEFVADRWSIPFWRIYDMALLWLALIHGVFGVRIAGNEYLHNPLLRGLFSIGLVAFAVVFLGIGTVTILIFEPI